MPDRDESKDVGLIWDSCGDTTPGTPRSNFPNEVEPWDEVEGCTYNGADEGWTRYVPHSDLEAAERERDALRQEASRLVEALGIARNQVEKLDGSSKALRRIRTAIDQAIAEFGKGEK
jgi:hypothetical protein